MVNDAKGIAFAMSLLCAAISSAQEQQPAVRPSTSTWTLDVLTLEATTPTALWVGLTNRSKEARLVCILDRGVSYMEANGNSRAVMEGGSPHECLLDEQFQLVHAQQTLFTRLALPEKVARRLRVEIGVVTRTTMPRDSGGRPEGVTWEGTLQQAIDRGRALAAGPGEK